MNPVILKWVRGLLIGIGIGAWLWSLYVPRMGLQDTLLHSLVWGTVVAVIWLNAGGFLRGAREPVIPIYLMFMTLRLVMTELQIAVSYFNLQGPICGSIFGVVLLLSLVPFIWWFVWATWPSEGLG